MASKVKIRINSNDKIEELLQETYNQACEQLTLIQEEMNKITKSTTLSELTIDEKSKYAKIMHDYSGDKDRAIRAKMDIAKLLIEIVNHRGSVEDTLNDKAFTKQPTSLNFDSLRKYAINEDNFQFSSQLGYKAVKNWYYSATLLFKTQFFNNYKSNTSTMTASFLSPAELNVGLGMTYNYKDKYETKVFTLSLAPLSYNLKICRDIDRLNPTTFGIDEGHHTKHSFGSNLEAKLNWKIRDNIVWTSRLYAFTNYEYVQGDWENTFDFSITRHLNTKLYVHLRYDKSHPWHADWKYWQLKEILSLGLTYRFSTN